MMIVLHTTHTHRSDIHYTRCTTHRFEWIAKDGAVFLDEDQNPLPADPLFVYKSSEIRGCSLCKQVCPGVHMEFRVKSMKYMNQL